MASYEPVNKPLKHTLGGVLRKNLITLLVTSTLLITSPLAGAQGTDQTPALLEQAKGGNADAQFRLGVMYHNGQGFVSDPAEAVRWWRLAAAQGNVNAQSGLGVMYGNGKGVTRDYVRAHMWFDLGATSGSTDSANNRDLIAKRMTPKQIAEAQKMAVECKNKGFKGCD